MSINIVACVNEDFGLGFQGKLMFHISNDLRRFKFLTDGGYTVYGRETYHSLPKLFNNRCNVILSKNPDFDINDELKEKYEVIIENDLEKVLNQYKFSGTQPRTMWICGGSQIYAQAFPYADRVFLTIVHTSGQEADAYFPKQELSEFEITYRYKEYDEKSGLYYSFINYKRKENVNEIQKHNN